MPNINLPKTIIISSKWSNFTESGHTASNSNFIFVAVLQNLFVIESFPSSSSRAKCGWKSQITNRTPSRSSFLRFDLYVILRWSRFKFHDNFEEEKTFRQFGKNGSFLPTKNGNISRALSLTSNLASNRYIQSIQWSWVKM